MQTGLDTTRMRRSPGQVPWEMQSWGRLKVLFTSARPASLSAPLPPFNHLSFATDASTLRNTAS